VSRCFVSTTFETFQPPKMGLIRRKLTFARSVGWGDYLLCAIPFVTVAGATVTKTARVMAASVDNAGVPFCGDGG
jgi:hypothetical protein